MAQLGETDDDLSLGEELMDSEHRAQLRLLELFEKSLIEGKGKDDLVIVLDRLIEFTNLHFLTEEMQMQAQAYPRLGMHVKEHDMLLDQARKIQAVFNVDDRTMTEAEIVTLRRWLTDHIRTKDLAFVRYLEQKQAGEEA